MNSFNNTVNQFLIEYPYIEYINRFDLELETKRDIQTLMNYLNDIFTGETKQDKYNNVISLQNDSEKRHFLNGILNDNMFKLYLKKLPEQESNTLQEFLKTISLKITERKPRSQYY